MAPEVSRAETMRWIVSRLRFVADGQEPVSRWWATPLAVVKPCVGECQ